MDVMYILMLTTLYATLLSRKTLYLVICASHISAETSSGFISHESEYELRKPHISAVGDATQTNLNIRRGRDLKPRENKRRS